MKTIYRTVVCALLRIVVLCDLAPVLNQVWCNGAPLQPDIDEDEPHRRELLFHFNPVLNDERITQVNDLLRRLNRHAKEKRFRFASGHGHSKAKHAMDPENNNITLASLNEIDVGNISVDNNTDENSPPEITATVGFVNRYLFEGDILLTPEQAKGIFDNLVSQPTATDREKRSVRRRQKRTALISGDSARWRSMPIRYDFDASIDSDDKEPIKSALEYWQTHTCVSFKYTPGVTNGDYLSFFKGNGCYSMVGKVGGKQGISVGDGCAHLGVVAHEIGHALGMWHEQSRPDSDRYIRIIPSNIIDGTLSNFLQRSWSETNSYEVSYDLGSVMHYGSTAFAIDSNKDSIETLLPGYQHTIGQRQNPAFLDVMAINKAYCRDSCSQSLACQYGGYVHPSSCDRCICPDGLEGTYCERPASSKNAECGGIVGVNNEWTNITSPNYPKNYATNQRCHWLVRAEPNARVQFQFVDDFKIYCTATCYDYVEIKNDTDFSKTGMRFCCNELPTVSFYSTTNEMLIIFNSLTTTEKGFKGRATQYFPSSSSAATITARSAESTSSTTTRTTTGSTTTSSTASTTSIATTTAATTTSTSSTTSATTTSTGTSSTTSATTTSTGTSSTTSTTTPVVTTTTESTSVTTSSTSTGAISTTESEISSTTSIVSVLSSSVKTVPSSTPYTIINSAWSVWSSWSACSKTCGACGVKSRQRQCLKTSCTGEAKQFKRCPFNICPGDTTCNKLAFLDFPCGGDGRVCSSVHEVMVKCAPICCSPFKPGRRQCELARAPPFRHAESDASNWNDWSEWGECFGPPCGGCARQIRYRVCQDEKCRGEEQESRPCNTQACRKCNDTAQPDVVETPCTHVTDANRSEMCQRPRRDAEVTCPCCSPLKEKRGRCV